MTAYYTCVCTEAFLSIPRDHHYIPKFYLKQWAGSDARLCEYKSLRSKIVVRCTFSTGTGYQRDLYRCEGLPDELAHQVEPKFMQMVDTRANYALEKIISGDTRPWDAKMRSAWIRFILSLRFRNPEAVYTIKQHIQEMWQRGIASLQASYATRRLPTDPPTFEEFMARVEPEAPQKGALILLQEIIDNDRVGPTIIGMHWSRVSLAASRLNMLTSDRPLNMTGLASKDAYIALPVSPSILFVAGHDDTWARRLSGADPRKVIKSVPMRSGITRWIIWPSVSSVLGSSPVRP
jgi:Protein of unknown function (DUF4238)